MEGFLRILLTICFFLSIILALVCIYRLVKKGDWKKPLLLAAACFAVFMTIGIFTVKPSSNQPASNNQKTEIKNNAKSLAEWDKELKAQEQKNINIIKKAVNVNDTDAAALNDIFFRIGIKAITALEDYYPGTSSSLTSPQLDGAIAAVYFDGNKKLDKIIFRNNVLFEEDKIKSNLSENILSTEEKSKAIIKARAAVRTHLGNNFDEFPADPIVEKNGNIIKAFGSVKIKTLNGLPYLAKYGIEFDSIWQVQSLTII